MRVSILVGQVPAVWDVGTNLATVREVVGEAQTGDVVVLPEGLLSGYGEDLGPVRDLDPAELKEAIGQVEQLARRHGVQVFCGSLLPEDGGWANAGLFFPAEGGHQVYRKINLAMNERGPLRAGESLPTFAVGGPDGSGFVAGVQLCREIRFPEQWQYLAAAGAQLLVYLTNAANPNEPAGVWRSHLISRAAENQRFLASANIVSPDQHCPSMVVSPRGEVLAEVPAGQRGVVRHTVDLSENSGWYLGQRRQDVVSLTYHRD
ncbi:putative amidohydrolase [Actinoplanes octamycinicus]|uniref:Putative amidohydrolase n=1 Tax=Actinoplanes octamycinicus TaxID=135948 RepID=A0A7W7H5I9_9ACTN|nr:carbon-nitrogen hydrolase family protein [Actinoplanes octamycinicus]MBB4744252.1 putative amidohydrolase [Actinoplanes octamycinicus]GIE56791.1 hydrolase MtnU [Actinoplanes octamycinicus]